VALQTGNEIKAGVMILVSAGLLAALLVAVGPCRSFLYQREEIHVVFREVSGLKPNSPVMYSGVEIGRVKEITIIQMDEANIQRLPGLKREHVFELPVGDPAEVDRIYAIENPAERNAEIIAAIRDKTMVELTLEVLRVGQFESCHVDDRVQVVSTLMGDTSVEISPGSGAICSPGRLLIGDAGTLFSDVRDSVNDIRRMMRRASEALGGEKLEFKKAAVSITEGAERFAKIAENVEIVTGDVREVVSSNKDDIREAVKDLRAFAAAGRAAMDDGGPRVKAILANAEKLTGTLSASAAKATKGLDGVLGAAARAAAAAEELMVELRPRLSEVLREARDALTQATKAGEQAREVIGESRADLRRSLLNIKGATRNVEEMTALLARRPWLVLRPSRGGDRDVAQLYVSTRHLYDATKTLTEATDRLGELGRRGRLPKTDVERLRELLEEVRGAAGEIESARKRVEKRVEEIRRPDRKGRGARFGRSREAAPEHPGLDELKSPGRR